MSRRSIAAVTGLTVFVAIWEAFVRVFDVRPFVLRAPSTAVQALWDFRSDFARAALVTAFHATTGLAVALVVGTVVGGVLAVNRFLDDAVQPVLVLVLVTPWFAYVGAVVLWLGAGTPPALFMVALVCLPAFVFAATEGMRNVEPAALEVFRSVAATRREVLWRLRLPSALPTLFAAARLDVGLALAAAYYVEGANFASDGIGAIGRRAASQPSGADTMWAAVLAMAVLGVAGLAIVSLVQRTVLHWHHGTRRPTR